MISLEEDMLISKKKLCSCSFFSILILYGLSRGSWGNVIPYTIWQSLVLLAGVYFGVCTLGVLKGSGNYYMLLCITLVFIVLMFNNYNLKNRDIYYESTFITLMLLSVSMINRPEWIKWSYKLMCIMGFFYALMTLVSFLSKSFYDTIIFPFISNYSTTTKYLSLSDYYAGGFTTHYSTNGMFVTLGVCMTCGWLIDLKEFSARKKFGRVCIVLLMLVALLLTNKRAHILFTCAGMLVCYYLYNSNRPVGRIGKIMGLLFGVVIFAYILYSIAPDTLRFLDRFAEEKAKGDVSSNRFMLWGLASVMLKGNYILGNGWFSFYYKYSYHVHNVYLQLLTEVGVVGSVFFYIFMALNYYRVAHRFIQSRRNQIELGDDGERRLAISIIYQTFFLLYGITGTCLYELQTLIPYIIMCAVGEYYWYNGK